MISILKIELTASDIDFVMSIVTILCSIILNGKVRRELTNSVPNFRSEEERIAASINLGN